MDSTGLRELVEENALLFWWIPPEKRVELSKDAIVETILNYGDIRSVKRLFSVMGIKETAKIFRKHAYAPRSNYFPVIRHFFTLYFDRHA